MPSRAGRGQGFLFENTWLAKKGVHFSVPITAEAKGDLRLIKLEPGKKLPEHRHAGEELVLVLRGSYRTGTSIYSKGDFAELDDENKNAMIAEQEGCILLIGNEAMPAFISRLD